ncbi:MAG TPA: hypothetical protein VGX25_20015 [Actinophytocola sp.]|uniref:hypothetical protein n=1 Tax=Actinophytocola sp. TaxID=1872138 RepID=UPI002DDDB744|nr:hypothetical protein [Actinophytocola sp.]HEV2781677.1 hypothetical protein [Actinophytocola sp.]
MADDPVDAQRPELSSPEVQALVRAMEADGVDLTDQAAVRDWLVLSGLDPSADADAEGFEFDDDLDEFDLDEAVSFKEAFGLPDRLPPLRLPEDGELAAGARTSPLLGRARQLAEWVGEGRAVTAEGELTGPDCAAAAKALGIDVPGPVERLGDVPELAHLWDLAESVEFVVVGADGQAGGGPGLAAWPDGDDEEVLDIWATGLAVTITSLDLDADLHGAEDEVDFSGAGGAVLVSLFLARNGGMPLGEVRALVDEMALVPDSWVGRHGEPVDVLLARLDELGAIARDGEIVRLTPLAQWAAWSQLMDSDVEVPLLPPVEEMTAGELVAAAEGFTEDELAAEMSAWLALRSPGAAAGELLDAAAAGGPADRMYATSVVTSQLAADAEPHWRAALDDPRLRAYAKLALDLKPASEDLAWLLTDLLAAVSEFDGPDEIAQQLADSVPPGKEQEIIDLMWRLPHPDAGEVLTMLGAHHPDREIAKAARKAAFKAASRNGS